MNGTRELLFKESAVLKSDINRVPETTEDKGIV